MLASGERLKQTRDSMNFGELDQAYEFAKSNGLPFKLHTLIWGQQQPNWITTLSTADQLAEIEEWMAALAARYPNVDYIDVVNEPLHAKPGYRAALGGEGTTGWDWVIKSFELARRYFPNADLHLNDYSVLTRPDFVTPYLTIVNLLNERGLIDGIGEQAHFYERAPDPAVMRANLDTLAATGLPLYISEFDVNFTDDARQAIRVSELFPRFWSHPSVLGVTYWGYRKGAMWQSDAWLTSADGTTPRAALTWMQCYMAGNENCPVPVYTPPRRTGDINQITLEAEDYDTASNLIPVGSAVGYASDGSWLRFDRVNLIDNWNTISATYAKPGTAAVSLSVHLDSLDNPPVAKLALGDSGSWGTFKTASMPWLPITGERTVFVRFNGGGANVDKIQIGAPQDAGSNIVADNDFELGTIDGWWTWAGPKDATTNVIANSTARSVTGTHSLVMSGRNGNSPLVNTFTSLAVPGKSYKASVWATIGGVASSAQVTTATQCVGGVTTYGRLGGWGNTKTLTDGVWTEFAGDIAVPNCQLANVALWLEGPGAGVDLYVDHVSVRPVVSANLISDGTFESGQGAWGGWGFGSLAVVNTSSHSGSQSLRATTMSQYGAIARDILPLVAPGKRYTATAWVSVGSLAAPGAVKWQTVQRCNGATGDSYPWLAGTTVSNGTWVQITGTVDLTGCTIVEKLMLFAGADAGDLYLDDVSLIAL